ncbi:MAG: hypothetical protein P4L85_20670 [Paludisphaera borealis]|uniref:hypothetical protein n=1 Tax=Paludisphaera borealis TaxID=1387353 RepID=UPI002846898E|nr:hypothetical protein [Paludisphaera borealis]MDR3621779.1 hypothetical protein [Paludisphaera borealis]
MRTAAPLVITLLIVSTAWVAPALAEPPTLATPPRQAEPWTPPETSLPRFFVSATAALFDQGLADPRGCEYRTIRIAIGSVWGGQTQEIATSGWVLPAADGGKPRHAVAWSGLVYPLIAAGEPADLAADARACIAPMDQRGSPRAFGGFRGNDAASSVAVESFHLIKVCLLLRLGRADLAEAAWAVRLGRREAPKPSGSKPKLDLNSYGVSYLSLATDLAWYHFDRAVCAHMRGDDPLALADARALDALGKAVDAKAEAMGFVRPQGRDRHIEFLGQAPELLADQERRARERGEPPARGKNPEDKVAALIRKLDQVAVGQMGQPGGVILGESPIVKDLIAEGEAAVEPLIQAFRSDDRLTRSVGFGRDFHRNRMILRVDQAAYAALTGVLKSTNFGPSSPEGSNVGGMSRKALADQIQSYWDKNKSVPLVERWYRTLADDEAGNAAWLAAAGMITQPMNVETIFGAGALIVTERKKVKPGDRPPLRGEKLRDGRAPSVADLMARRAESMRTGSEVRRSASEDSAAMIRMREVWDPTAVRGAKE